MKRFSWKKFLSLVLVAALVVSTLQFGNRKAVAATELTDDSRIVGYAMLDASGDIKNIDSDDFTVTKDGVTIGKSITKVGETGYDYDIKLSVKTSRTVETSDLAVVLLVDASSTMKNNKIDGKTRLQVAQEAAKSFVSRLDTKSESNVYISVAYFYRDAERKLAWTKFSADTKQTIENAIDGIPSDKSGTNIDAGLRLAYNMLNAGAGKTCANRVVVLLSDGEPYGYVPNRPTQDDEEAVKGYTSTSDKKVSCDKTLEAADKLKKDDFAKIYSIYIGDVDAKCYTSSKTVPATTYTKFTNSNNQEYRDATDRFQVSDVCNVASNNSVAEISDVQVFEAKGRLGKDARTCKHCNLEKRDHKMGYYAKVDTVTSVTYTIRDFFEDLSSSINGEPVVKPATDAASLTGAFSDILTATITGATGLGWTVTDPMPAYIQYSADNAKALTEGTLIWSLTDDDKVSSSTAGGTTSYKYEYTYRITVDPTAEGFTAGANLLTNGITYLTKGNDGSMNFKVPVVKAYPITRGYSVNLYKKNKTTGEYEPVTADCYTGKAKVGETVTVSDYIYKYKSDHYIFKSGSNELDIGKDESKNVIDLYYDPIETNVKVIANYQLTGWDADGKKMDVHTNDVNVTPDGSYFVGDSFTFDSARAKKCGGYTYEFESSDPEADESGKVNITLAECTETETPNTIVLNYKLEQDLRKSATIEVEHVYIHNFYKLEDGRWVPDSETDTVTIVEETEKKASESFTIDAVPRREGYDLCKIEFNGTQTDSTNVTLIEGKNKAVVTFEWNEEFPAYAKVIVNYHYTLTKNTVVNGIYTPGTAATADGTPVEVCLPVGETWKVSDISEEFIDRPVFNERTYVADPSNSTKLESSIVIKAATEDDPNPNVIDLYYTLTTDPEPATLTVNHKYITRVYETKTVYNASGAAIGTETVPTDTFDTDQDIYTNNGDRTYFEGELIPSVLKERTGFSVTTDSTVYTNVTVNNQTVDIEYLCEQYDDFRIDREVIVRHEYYQNIERVVNGELTLVTNELVGTVSEADDIFTPVFDGDEITVTEKCTYGGKNYTRITDKLTYIVDSDSEIVIKYLIGDQKDLTDADLTAKYVYNTYTMAVGEDGVAKYPETPESETVTATATPVGPYYKDMQVEIADGSKEGFTALGTNPAYVQILAAGSNEFTYVFEKYVPLDQADVEVEHIYKIETIDVAGVHSETEYSGTPDKATKYVGETYLAELKKDGFELIKVEVDGADKPLAAYTMTAGTDKKTVYTYYKLNDNSQPASYSINHIYRTIDWDGEVTVATAPAITGTDFATNVIKANPDTIADSYKLISVEGADDNSLGLDAYTMTLKAGDGNSITFTYEKKIDSRVAAPVKVVYHYAKFDSYRPDLGEQEVGTFTKTYYGVDEGAWVGREFKFGTDAPNIPDYEGKTYSFKKAVPETLIIKLVTAENPDENVIDAYYVSTYSSYIPYGGTGGGGDDEGDEPTPTPIVKNDTNEEKKTDNTPTVTPTPTEAPEIIEVEVPETPEIIEVEVPETPEGPAEEPKGTEIPEGKGRDVDPAIVVSDNIPVEPEVVEIPETVTPQGGDEDLPQTGTTPVGFFYGIGAACVLFGGVLAVTSKKRKEDK